MLTVLLILSQKRTWSYLKNYKETRRMSNMERHSSYMRVNKTRALQLENRMSDGKAIGRNVMEKGQDGIITCSNKCRQPGEKPNNSFC